MTSTSTLLTLLVRLCYQANDHDQLLTQLTIMSKKHGQLKEAVVRMVDESMTWLPELKEKKDKGEYKDGKDRWLELLNTLRDITEGKVCQLTVALDVADYRSTLN
jgi:26S proteasome regulatory subunit N5